MKPAAFLVIVISAVAIGSAFILDNSKKEKAKAAAIAVGFVDAEDMERASNAGLKADPAGWIAEKNRRAEIDRASRAKIYEATRDPGMRMTMPAMSWNVGGFKNVGIVNVTIDNGNDFPVKDIDIQCIFSGKSGTVLTRADHRIYDTIPAKSRRAFKEVNVGLINSQSAKAGCTVEAASRL